MSSGRILWVGGQEADHHTLQSLLHSAGLPDVYFAQPAEAIEAVAKRQIGLLILDVMQLSADVQQLLRAAAPATDSPTGVPVILSAPEQYLDRVHACLGRGAQDFFTTPLDATKPLLVVRRIEHLLKSRPPHPIIDIDETQVIPLNADASRRFVPHEFLEHLQRRSLSEVRLGDHVEREMAVFFCDIRDFTRLSEKLTPQQNFAFLNSYLRQVNPIIHDRHGFIDKYIGDAIMALFPRSSQDALQAGVDLQKAVARYNLGRLAANYEAVRIGIGMHFGKLILGTIGEEERMQTTVIADVVNLASRLEGLTKVFGVSMLVSQAIVDGLSDPSAFRLRDLGAVRAKGKTESVEIYECYDNDPDELRAHKDETRGAFAAAMEEFKKGMFLTAGKIFAKISQMNRSDGAAAYYTDRCTLQAVRGRGPGVWDGAEKIEVK